MMREEKTPCRVTNQNEKDLKRLVRFSWCYFALVLLPIICFLSLFPIGQSSAQIILPPTIQANETSEIPKYVDHVNGISIEHPHNWTTIESNESVIFVAPPQEKLDRDLARLTLAVEKSNKTLEDLTNSYTTVYESVRDNFKIGTSSAINLKGHAAQMLTFTSTSSNSNPENNIL